MAEFALRMQDMRVKPPPPWKLDGGRVLDKRQRYRTIEISPKKWVNIKICYHGRSLDHPCGLCAYESVRLEGER